MKWLSERNRNLLIHQVTAFDISCSIIFSFTLTQSQSKEKETDIWPESVSSSFVEWTNSYTPAAAVT